ncbi:hypothetical protein BS78_05G120700, partial [Paspalum vaginatum]
KLLGVRPDEPTLLLSPFQIGLFTHPVAKEDILQHCEDYIKHGGSAPSLHSRCCVAALEVPNLDMQCIIHLLTAKEKWGINQTNIMMLQNLCNPLSGPPPHKVMVQKGIA